MTEPVEREELHQRQLDLRFYRRSDGLYEVEGRLIDVKNHPFRRQLAEEDSPAGAELHNIVVRLVLDASLTVQEALAWTHTAPFPICPQAGNSLSPLVGLQIGAGWNKRVRERLGRSATCTHMVELLGPMATTALQGTAPERLARIDDPANEQQRRDKVDSCYAYGAQREVVARLWPYLHRPAVEAVDAAEAAAPEGTPAV